MSGPVRSLGGLALRLAARWWPQLAAVAAACGVVAATIAGGLGVGEAVRGGLRRLAVGRLGHIETAVLGDAPFRRSLAAELAERLATAHPRATCTPALVLPATLSAAARPGGTSPATLLACDEPAALGFTPAPPPLEGNAAVVNEPLAAVLGVAAGDEVVLRVSRWSHVPADMPLGRRTPYAVGRRLRVAAVVPAAGLGGFSLRPSMAAGPLAVVSLGDGQAILREGDVANAVFIVAPGGGASAEAVAAAVRPTVGDLGLDLEAVDAPDGAEVLRLTSRRLVIPPEADRAAARVLRAEGGVPSLAFLATSIEPVDPDDSVPTARVPYSTVLGVDSTDLPGGPLLDGSGTPLGPPPDDGIIVDRWLADDLAAQGRPLALGDRLAITAFLPETVHGRVEERTERLRVVGIAEMTGAAVDRSLVPGVAGVTDEASIAEWDPPFPFDASRVRTVPPHDEDERYWKRYRATPKAFVSLATARRIAGSRFGVTTAWHVPAGGSERDELAGRIAAAIDPSRAGLRVVPLRAEAEAAARGSTPFAVLFLALSSFVVAAGMLLAWLLMGLLVAAQARTVGALAAVGFAPRRLAALLVLVAAAAAAAGSAAGAAAGPAWTRAAVALLGGAWDRDVAAGSAAVFAERAVSPAAVLGGAVASLVLGVATVTVAAVRIGRLPPLAILRNAARTGGGPAAGRALPAVAAGGIGVAAVLAVAGSRATGSPAAGLFFAAGAAALVGMLAAVRAWLGTRPRRTLRTLPHLAARSLASRPGRSASISAMVACGTFLVAAASAFSVRPPTDPADRSAATGGWTGIVSFSGPTSVDVTDAATREALGLRADESRALAGCTIALLRASDGDDASCANLHAATRPGVVGVGPGFIARGGFRFVAHDPLDGADAGNPWRLLDRPSAARDGPVPAILDQATAQWGLRLGGVGSRFELADGDGSPVGLRIVGLLEPGILQGRVIVSERSFERLYPSRSGYSLALVDDSRLEPGLRPLVPAAARAAWIDSGAAYEPAVGRLRSLQAVQNTFLLGFQALGTLGLLLGTAGVAAVQLQGVVERLDQLATLRAVGFTPARVRTLLLVETLVTVGCGVVAGAVAAAVAVWPAVADGTARLPFARIAALGGLTVLVAMAVGWVATGRVAVPERPAA